MKKYVWLNKETGQLSKSWKEENNNNMDLSKIAKIGSDYVLIEYRVVNDSKFEFNEKMVLK